MKPKARQQVAGLYDGAHDTFIRDRFNRKNIALDELLMCNNYQGK